MKSITKLIKSSVSAAPAPVNKKPFIVRWGNLILLLIAISIFALASSQNELTGFLNVLNGVTWIVGSTGILILSIIRIAKKYNRASSVLWILLTLVIGLLSVFWLDARFHDPDFYSDEKLLRASREYHPDPAIAKIAEETTMTEKAKALFYSGIPEIAVQNDIDYFCKTDELKYIKEVQGCFGVAAHPGWFSKGRGYGIPVSGPVIFILKLKNESPDSYSVTGAHEMLHYAYARLDDKEKERVNKLLETEFQKRKANEVLVETIENYKKDGLDIMNELHSEFGTGQNGIWQKSLDPELEEYYKQYFTDRSKVVKLTKRIESY